MLSQKALPWNVAMMLFLLSLYVITSQLYEGYLANVPLRYAYLHEFLHVLVIAFSIAISVLMWHVSRMRHQMLHVWMGALFLVLSMLQIVLFILSNEIVFFESPKYVGLAVFLNTCVILLVPAGGIAVSIYNERTATLQQRNMIYLFSFLVGLAIIAMSYVVYLNGWYMLNANQLHTWKITTTTIAIVLFIILAVVVMPRYYVKLQIRIQYTWCFILFVLMLLVLQQSTQKMDFYYIYGQMMEVLAYMFLTSAVFSLTIESPYHYLAKSREKVRKIAYYHEVTNLPNRIYFRSLINKNVLMHDCEETSIIVLEIQRLAQVRSLLGTNSTHHILRSVTVRLQGTLPEQAVLGMLKDDKIGIMLPCEVEANHDLMYERLAREIQKPINVHHYVLQLDIKIGIAQYPEHGRDAETLIKHANLALLEATKNERPYVVYTDMLEFEGRYELQLEHDLQHAIARKELYINYQPQLDMETGQIYGAEALVRWQHPREGIISPDQFIPIAERTGIILKMGEWVLYEACQDAKYWASLMQRPIKMAVNMSVSQLLQPGIVQAVQNALDTSGLEASYLTLEITESMTVDRAVVVPVLQKLKALGVRIALDDFGTGYSSFSYLSDLPLDYLKVDRSFVNHIAEHKKDQDVIRAILTMSHTLKLQTVVEGVETVEQFNVLQQLPCDYVQGYFVSKPVRFYDLVKYDGQLAAQRNEYS